MAETLVVCDRHDNRALVVLEDEPLSLREFQVSLRGPKFELSLFHYLKFWAGHFDLIHWLSIHSRTLRSCPWSSDFRGGFNFGPTFC